MRYDPEETTKEARVLCFTNHFASFLVSYPRSSPFTFSRRSPRVAAGGTGNDGNGR